MSNHDELCVSYAALMLHDGGVEINEENLLKLITASGNEVEAYWPMLFSQLLQKQDINELICVPRGGGGAGGAGGAGGDAAAEEEEKEEEEEEEEAVEVGNMFGGDEDDGW
jgi:ribosomal protein L12E/L44/L45/RPP1/RPP2